MKDNALVSVVMATYNGERFLKEQLDSILNQTYANIEVIAIDDASSDRTVSILKQYAEKDDRIKVTVNELNLGYTKNFEKGIRLASGNYIAFSDQDDIWMAEKLSTLMNEMAEHPVVYCDSELIDDNGNSLNKKISSFRKLGSYNSCLNFAIDNCVSGHAAIIKKELLLNFLPFPSIPHYDHWLAFNSTFGGGVKYIDKPLVKHRSHASSAVGVFAKKKLTGVEKTALKKKESKESLERVKQFFNKCPKEFPADKKVLLDLMLSYESFSLKNNIRRVHVFMANRKDLLVIRKRSAFRKWFYCLKMFYRIK